MSPLLITGLIFLFGLSAFLMLKKKAAKTAPSTREGTTTDIARIGWLGQLWRAGVLLVAVVALVCGFFYLVFRDQTGWLDTFQIILIQEPRRYVNMPRAILLMLGVVLACVLVLRTLHKMLFPAGQGRGYFRASVALAVIGIGLQAAFLAFIFMDDMDAGRIETRITWKLNPQSYMQGQAVMAFQSTAKENPAQYCLQLRLKDPISVSSETMGPDGRSGSYELTNSEAMAALDNKMPYICTETAKRDIVYKLASNYAFLANFKTRCPSLSASNYCTEAGNNLLDYGTPTRPTWLATSRIKDDNDPDKGNLNVIYIMDTPGYILSVMADWDKDMPVDQLEEKIRNNKFAPSSAKLYVFDCKTGQHRNIWVDTTAENAYTWWKISPEDINTAKAEPAFEKATVGDEMYFNACFT